MHISCLLWGSLNKLAIYVTECSSELEQRDNIDHFSQSPIEPSRERQTNAHVPSAKVLILLFLTKCLTKSLAITDTQFIASDKALAVGWRKSIGGFRRACVYNSIVSKLRISIIICRLLNSHVRTNCTLIDGQIVNVFSTLSAE